MNVWAFVTDNNYAPVENEEVILYTVVDGVETVYGSSVTDSMGIAYLSYVGSGVGNIGLKAKCGSLVSETCSLLDCYKYDSGMSDYNDIWTQSSQNVLIRDSSGEYSTIKETTIGTTAFVTITNIPLTDYRVEVDVFQVDGTQNEWFLTVLKQDYSSIRSADSKLNEWKHISLDLTNIEANSRVRLSTGGTATEMKFKNFKLYPI